MTVLLLLCSAFPVPPCLNRAQFTLWAPLAQVWFTTDLCRVLDDYASAKASRIGCHRLPFLCRKSSKKVVFGCPRREAKQTDKMCEPLAWKIMPPLLITLDIGCHQIKATAEVWKKDLCFLVQWKMSNAKWLENQKTVKLMRAKNYNT